MALSERSLRNLDGVHPDLIRVVKRAAEREAFIVTEGLRNVETQKEYIKKGVSWKLDSRHLTGHAVDVVDADGCYDLPDMIRIGKAMKQAAAELNIPIVWGALKKHGGDWTSRNDTPHFELDSKAYPASGITTTQKIAEKVTNAATSKPAVAVATGVATGVAANPPALPPIPAPPDLSAYTAWQSFGETVSSLGNWVWAHPVLTFGIAGWIGWTVYWPQIKARLAKLASWRPA